MNRRDLLVAAVATANVKSAELQAQTPTPDDLALVRRAIQANREAMAKAKLPMSVEPAFQFKA